jgi:molecular chaperone IbpA
LEDGVLTIKSIKEELEDKEEDGVIHKGIAKRYFSKAFTIADDVEVKGAELKDGLLKVSLERIVPESKKPRTIEVK